MESAGQGASGLRAIRAVLGRTAMQPDPQCWSSEWNQYHSTADVRPHHAVVSSSGGRRVPTATATMKRFEANHPNGAAVPRAPNVEFAGVIYSVVRGDRQSCGAVACGGFGRDAAWRCGPRERSMESLRWVVLQSLAGQYDICARPCDATSTTPRGTLVERAVASYFQGRSVGFLDVVFARRSLHGVYQMLGLHCSAPGPSWCVDGL